MVIRIHSHFLFVMSNLPSINLSNDVSHKLRRKIVITFNHHFAHLVFEFIATLSCLKVHTWKFSQFFAHEYALISDEISLNSLASIWVKIIVLKMEFSICLKCFMG